MAWELLTILGLALTLPKVAMMLCIVHPLNNRSTIS